MYRHVAYHLCRSWKNALSARSQFSVCFASRLGGWKVNNSLMLLICKSHRGLPIADVLKVKKILYKVCFIICWTPINLHWQECYTILELTWHRWVKNYIVYRYKNHIFINLASSTWLLNIDSLLMKKQMIYVAINTICVYLYSEALSVALVVSLEMTGWNWLYEHPTPQNQILYVSREMKKAYSLLF